MVILEWVKKGGSIMLTNFGKKLRILRINTGETIVEMSEKLGLSTSYLSSIENGKRKIPKHLERKRI